MSVLEAKYEPQFNKFSSLTFEGNFDFHWRTH